MSKRRKGLMILFIMLLLMLSLLIPKYTMVYTNGKLVDRSVKKPIKVVDYYTGKPIEGALITSGNDVERADENGMCYMKIEGNKVAVRAYGYLRTEQMITSPQEIKSLSSTLKAIYLSLREKVAVIDEQMITAPLEIKLVPFTPKALYLSFYGIGDKTLRESALKLIQETELNALVIDVKGDRGMLPYKSTIPLAAEVGAQKIITVKDMSGLIKSLKEKDIYTIARIVVFKDNLLALKRPDLAVKTQSGEIWRDREDLAWVDPFKKEVWDYNINIAVEIAQYGFDEIQFDYVRFPDPSSFQCSMPNTMENRVKAISGFLLEAKKRLLPYNVFLSADIFGYVCWNLNDTYIGQTLEELAPHLDYLSPMLYPSGFQYGIPGYRIPVTNPYEIVYLALKRAQERTNLPAIRFRPWLQAFRDYAFDGRIFEEKEIRDQINAAEKFGSHGWMLWNPRNIYSGDGLKRDAPP
ncbi:putative glycoside hydrolase [bacterium]|nr:putative glycoside hydrolase [bacterium]MCG2678232.1 putative glycoside hydrolase [bacterium]